MRKTINDHISSSYTRQKQLCKKIAAFLNLDYSITNRSVKLNYQSNNIANIIINNDWDNKVDFDLNQLTNK